MFVWITFHREVNFIKNNNEVKKLPYTALYRKFRPLTFDEMVGQEHITKTLKNQIIQDRVGHAYLFSGGRGTGKTSAAKILARAVNCLSPKNGEPCNECEICREILSGALTDVVEMDAASNNSVEDIRAIRDEVNFLPTAAKYRVYIIDEVHMLSTGAFNALLKTLEEPPKHVKFLLATTEPQKLPATILSRCQRFDFKRISEANIVKRLETICKESKIEISKQALSMIAILAEGALRDGISILERCIQEEAGNKIEEDIVRELVGIPKVRYVNNVVSSIINNDVQSLLTAVDEVIDEGKDIDNFLWEVIKYIKDILLYKCVTELPLYNEGEKEYIAKLSENVTKERLLNLIYAVSELANTIRWSSGKNIMLQVGLIKACVDDTVEVIVPDSTNKKPETDIKKESAEIEAMPMRPEKKDIESKKGNKKTGEKELQNSNTNYVPYWAEILDLLKTNGKVMLYTNLIGTRAKKANDTHIEIEFSGKITAFARSVLEQYENKEELSRMVSTREGQTIQIKYVENVGNDVSDMPKKGNGIESDIGIKINIIDE